MERTPVRTIAGQLEDRRIRVSAGLDRAHRARLGQFFTPAPVAQFMASLLDFSPADEPYLLDAGAGIGSLTAAAAQRAGDLQLRVTCYELESQLQSELAQTLAQLGNVTGTIEQTDFIEHAVRLALANKTPGYSHAIINPPYKKLGAGSQHRLLLRKLGVEAPNLYACFLACTIALCRVGAQIAAIIPRSFMNGVYFKPFRYWLLKHAAFTRIHVLDSRNRAFADDNVLQETVILRMVVGMAPQDVEVTASTDHRFDDMRARSRRFLEIVTPGDDERFIHVPSVSDGDAYSLSGCLLREIGLDVCTGPVVDFRLRDHLCQQPESGSVPLLYAAHFIGGFQWPRAGRKPNAIQRNKDTDKWLMPSGSYVVLRRFSSKEEKRRVVAYLLDEKSLPGDAVGFENHLNVIHQNHRGLDATVARGLVHYLNSQAVDDYFRTFSGHTQVNATDLRRLRYPSIDELRQLANSSDEQRFLGPH
jgi:adenine-specific DNA-methyltransferase